MVLFMCLDVWSTMAVIASSVVDPNRQRLLLWHDLVMVCFRHLYQNVRVKKMATMGKELTQNFRCVIVNRYLTSNSLGQYEGVSAGTERGLARTLMASYYGEH